MIGRLYRWLFDNHRHDWETIEHASIKRTRDGALIGTTYTLRCKTCGDITGRHVGLWG